MKRSRKREGFTLLEVMMTLAIMMVALMGIVALERAAVRANIESRATSVAATNNARWSAILRREALVWTTDQNTPTTANYLSTASEATWTIPVVPGGSVDTIGLDWYGQPTTTVDDIRFCTLLRFRTVVPNVSMRAEVVTFWAGSATSSSGSAGTFTTLCVAGAGETAGDALFGSTPDPRLRHIRSTVLLRSVRQ